MLSLLTTRKLLGEGECLMNSDIIAIIERVQFKPLLSKNVPIMATLLQDEMT